MIFYDDVRTYPVDITSQNAKIDLLIVCEIFEILKFCLFFELFCVVEIPIEGGRPRVI